MQQTNIRIIILIFFFLHSFCFPSAFLCCFVCLAVLCFFLYSVSFVMTHALTSSFPVSEVILRWCNAARCLYASVRVCLRVCVRRCVYLSQDTYVHTWTHIYDFYGNCSLRDIKYIPWLNAKCIYHIFFIILCK